MKKIDKELMVIDEIIEAVRLNTFEGNLEFRINEVEDIDPVDTYKIINGLSKKYPWYLRAIPPLHDSFDLDNNGPITTLDAFTIINPNLDNLKSLKETILDEKNGVKELFTEEGPPPLTYEDLDKKDLPWRIEEQRRRQEEKHHRELLRLQRISGSGKQPLIYTIDKIIEQCLINKNMPKVQIDFYSLGFEDNSNEVYNANRFFIQLRDVGCFADVERVANTQFIVTKPNLDKIKEYKKNILEPELNCQNNNAILALQKNNKLPFLLESDENIYKKGKKRPILNKMANKCYYFIRGCTELANEDNTVDVSDLYSYLLKNNDKFQPRFRIKDKSNFNEQWDKLSDTYNNIKRDYIKDLNMYIKKQNKRLKQFKWVVS